MSKFFDRIDELNATVNKGNIFNPPITDREAVVFLENYLLKDGDIYISTPMSHEQMNTEIVFTILKRYSRKFRKELKQWEKKHK